jgi:aspartate aminotransferase-like enzyme
MSRPIIPHRSPEFENLFQRCAERLAKVFRTAGPVLTVAGSGTTAVEAAMLSMLTRGDRVLTCAGGKFGRRWQQVYDRIPSDLRVSNTKLSVKWGQPVPPDRLETALRNHRHISSVTLVHSETSSATAIDLRALVDVVRTHTDDALVIVDAITSAGAIPMEMDEWDVDVAVGASQKAFMLPPGLGFVALSERAVARLEAIRHGEHLAPLAMDLDIHLDALREGRTPYTPPISLIHGLDAALDLMLERGMESVWARTAALAAATRQAFTAMGLSLASESPSDSVTGVFLPDGTADQVRKICLDDFNVALAGGQNDWKGRVVRLSHMGAVSEADTIAGVEAVARALEGVGAAGVDPARGIESIRASLADGA